MKILTRKYEKYYHNTKTMKKHKKYWKYSSRGRKVGRCRGRHQTRYLNLNTWTSSKLRTIPGLTAFLYYS